MRSLALFLASLALTVFFVLPITAHAAIPFLGPIIPDTTNTCPLGWAAVIIVINNIISFLITIAIVFVAPIMIAYAGFLFVWNPMNPGGIAKAKSMLTNVVVGIVVALAAWMIVDAVMAVLYNSTTPVSNGNSSSVLKTWSAIINWNGDPCLFQAGSLETLTQAQVTGVSAAGNYITPLGKSAALCATAACNPASLQNATVGFTATQAKVMSCIAVTENSGYSTGCNGNACGTFQIMLTSNPLVGSACAKYNPTGGSPLNCPALCKGANGAAVKNEPSCQPCVQAANDALCNAQTAKYLYSKNGYTPWTVGNKNSPACIAAYGNG